LYKNQVVVQQRLLGTFLGKEKNMYSTHEQKPFMGQEQIMSIAGQPAVDEAMIIEHSPLSEQEKTPFILVVTRNGHMTEPVMNYAINVADRLKYGILAVHINTLPFFSDGGRREMLFAAAMQESVAVFREKAGARGVLFKHLGEAGKIGKVVTRLCHSQEKIEFVVIDQGIRREEVTSQAPVPVFSVMYTTAGTYQINKTTSYTTMKKGELFMSTTSKKRHVKNCLLFGALTVGVYAAVFANQDLVMKYFTKGGLYALLPVAVVFAVSYVHGNFTSAFWSALGIEGSKATVSQPVADVRQNVPAADAIRKDERPRAQVSV
jgi:hypothetical protein